MKTTKELIESNPILIDEHHWNCGKCGCSHITYNEAIECEHTESYYNQKWYSKEEIIEKIFMFHYDEYIEDLDKIGRFKKELFGDE